MALVADNVREEMTPQQLLQYEAMQTPDPLRASLFERRVAAQVAYLASQHHASDYNRLKFGANGAPGVYVPLSIQLPSHARELRMYQAMTVEREHPLWWWAADRLSTLHRAHAHAHAHPILEARTGSLNASQDTAGDLLLHLEQELSDAIASHIPQPPRTVPRVAAANDRVGLGTKTSESHPINMSTVIPYDLLPDISAFFFTKQQHQSSQPPSAPTFLHLPSQLRLDCLMPVPVLAVAVAVAVAVPPPPPARRSAFSQSHPHHPALVIPPAALQADLALAADDPTPPPLAPGQVAALAALALAPTHVPLPPSPVTRSVDVDVDAPETNANAPKGKVPPWPLLQSASAELPTDVLEAIEDAASSALPSACPAPPPPPPPTTGRPLQPRTNGVVHHSSHHPGASNGKKHAHAHADGLAAAATIAKRLGHGHGRNSAFAKGTPAHPILNGVPSTPILAYKEFSTPPPLPLPPLPLPLPAHANGNGNGPRLIAVHGPLIGNLLLSSCPGKKVRLNGPVKGRGTIYRNLGLDMQRMKDAGVRCVVCCLDDSELQFLGAPWEDYAREASVVGLDVLRIPTPEGFAPLAPGMLNDQLDFLIRKYTLQGQNILVHCRGGVGRAGLVACCWMLKMGLCGWIQRGAPVNGHTDTTRVNGVMNQDHPPAKTTAETFLHRINGHAPGPVLPAVSNSHSAPLDDNPQPPTRTRTRTRTRIRLPSLSAPPPPLPPPPLPPLPPPPPPIHWDTVDLVERVVRVVRWRRSVKAIETYEQVRFLVEFVEFLRGGCVPTPTPAVECVDTTAVVNGYAKALLDGAKENGVMADSDVSVVRKELEQGTYL